VPGMMVSDSYGITLAVQWVGRTPWFCKYKTGAWPSDWCPLITKSKVPDLSKHGFHYKIKAVHVVGQHSYPKPNINILKTSQISTIWYQNTPIDLVMGHDFILILVNPLIL
jgi:hypothetical protein